MSLRDLIKAQEDGRDVRRMQEIRDELFPTLPAPYALLDNCPMPPYFKHRFVRCHKFVENAAHFEIVTRCKRCTNLFVQSVRRVVDKNGVARIVKTTEIVEELERQRD